MNDTLKVAGRIGAELGAAKAENERLRGLLHGAHDTIRELAEDLDEEEFQATIDQLAEIELALAPKQAEPTDTFTAVDMATAAAQGFRDGQAAVEPAPAQDEQSPEQMLSREQIENIARKVHGDCTRLPGATYQHAAEAAVMHTLERIARPTQTEQQPSLPVDSEAWLQEWARGKFTYTGAYKPRVLGQLYGNTDWALARALHSAIVSQLHAPIAQTEQRPIGRVFTDEERFRSDGKSGPVWWFGPLPAGAMLYAAPNAHTAPQPEQSGLVEALEEIASGLQAEFAWEVAEQALAAYRAALSAQGAGDASA